MKKTNYIIFFILLFAFSTSSLFALFPVDLKKSSNYSSLKLIVINNSKNIPFGLKFKIASVSKPLSLDLKPEGFGSLYVDDVPKNLEAEALALSIGGHNLAQGSTLFTFGINAKKIIIDKSVNFVVADNLNIHYKVSFDVDSSEDTVNPKTGSPGLEKSFIFTIKSIEEIKK